LQSSSATCTWLAVLLPYLENPVSQATREPPPGLAAIASGMLKVSSVE